jgi:DNA polymerase-1
MDGVSYKLVADYAAENTDVILRLYHRLEYELKKISLDKLCNEIEFPLIEVLADMEYNGIKVDEEILKQMNEEFIGIEKRLEKEICDEAGEVFN